MPGRAGGRAAGETYCGPPGGIDTVGAGCPRREAGAGFRGRDAGVILIG